MRKGDYLLVTNNPLVERCMGEHYPVRLVEGGYKDVLIAVRDLVYQGHTLYTHPLAGSVKPNETIYRSIAVSKKPRGLSAEFSELISNSLAAFEKFTPRQRILTDKLKKDFQLVDLALIAGAMEFDITTVPVVME
ncbi:MAG: GrdX family protein [Clostridia bacterium]|nr:GrdX family protein [Clostridia bacterium]